jgi:hypothetical protein
MNLQSQIELQAYGTSEGVQKAWDTRGRGRKFQTGVPVTMTAYHVTEIGKVQFGKGGAFFSPEPGTEYGTKILRAKLHFDNPLVVGDAVDAANKLMSKEDAAKVEKLFVEDIPMGDVEPEAGWRQIDSSVAEAARSKGYDGIIYTQPDSLTSQEYVALNESGYKVMPGERDVEDYRQEMLDKLTRKKH